MGFPLIEVGRALFGAGNGGVTIDDRGGQLGFEKDVGALQLGDDRRAFRYHAAHDQGLVAGRRGLRAVKIEDDGRVAFVGYGPAIPRPQRYDTLRLAVDLGLLRDDLVVFLDGGEHAADAGGRGDNRDEEGDAAEAAHDASPFTFSKVRWKM